jgi:4-hydroxybenzoate polyprenyltransferase
MNIQTFIKISRPKFWNYLAGTFLVGYSLGTDSLTDFYIPIFWILLGYFLLPANFFLYGINDLFDQDTDQFNTKKNTAEHRLKNRETRQLTHFIWITALCSILILWILPSLLTKIIFLLFIFLSFAYSAPPFRFKAKPVIDSISNILYILPGLIGYLALSDKAISFEIILAMSAWAIAMHLFSAIPDILPDKKARLATSAVCLGEKTSLIICSLLWSVFVFISLSQTSLYPFNLLTLIYPLIPLYIIFKQKSNIMKIYWLFPYLNTIIGFILFLLLIFPKL